MTREAAACEELPQSTLAAADFAAGIAAQAIRLARLYLERAQMFSDALAPRKAAADRRRAAEACAWGIEAANTANAAGRDLLVPLLIGIRNELNSFSGRHRASPGSCKSDPNGGAAFGPRKPVSPPC